MVRGCAIAGVDARDEIWDTDPWLGRVLELLVGLETERVSHSSVDPPGVKAV